MGEVLAPEPVGPVHITDDVPHTISQKPVSVVCAQHHFGRLAELDEAELEALSNAIGDFEGRVSSDRRERFNRLDALSAELVRRYRDGEANVDSLLND